jgi:hypothetical protein
MKFIIIFLYINIYYIVIYIKIFVSKNFHKNLTNSYLFNQKILLLIKTIFKLILWLTSLNLTMMIHLWVI